MNIADWVGAVDRHDQSGDYGVFAPLLPQDAAVQELEQASFYERTSNSAQAKEKLSTFYKWFKNAVLPPAAQLFRLPLEKRIDWSKGLDRASREKRLAENYRERKDYLRAAIFGYESLVTQKAVELKVDPAELSGREDAAKALQQDSMDFKELTYLRNAMAHGLLSAREETKKTLSSEEHLRSALKSLFGRLFRK